MKVSYSILHLILVHGKAAASGNTPRQDPGGSSCSMYHRICFQIASQLKGYRLVLRDRIPVSFACTDCGLRCDLCGYERNSLCNLEALRPFHMRALFRWIHLRQTFVATSHVVPFFVWWAQGMHEDMIRCRSARKTLIEQCRIRTRYGSPV